MKPVTVSITVPQPRQEVYEYLDVLENHERFTDHFLVDWQLSGPPKGVGARARMRVKTRGAEDWLDMEVIAAEPPRMTMEESTGANGRRRTRGTYVLDELPGGGTRISLELAWLSAPLPERGAARASRPAAREPDLVRASRRDARRRARAVARNERRAIMRVLVAGASGAIGLEEPAGGGRYDRR